MRRGITVVDSLGYIVVAGMMLFLGWLVFLSVKPTPKAVVQAQAVYKLQGTLPGAATNVQDLGNNWRVFTLKTADGKTRRFLYRDTSHTAYISNYTHSELLVELR